MSLSDGRDHRVAGNELSGDSEVCCDTIGTHRHRTTYLNFNITIGQHICTLKTETKP